MDVEPLRARTGPIEPAVGRETQPYGTLLPVPLGLGETVRAASVAALNQLLADTMALRDLYKKHHWQTTGPTFRELQELYDTHYEAQLKLMDALAERIMTLGGVSLAAAQDVVAETRLPRPHAGGRLCPTRFSGCATAMSGSWHSPDRQRARLRRTATKAPTILW
jgi:starvation-inducible DNA-binding protein